MLSIANAGDPIHASNAASSKQRFTSSDLERMESGFYLLGSTAYRIAWTAVAAACATARAPALPMILSAGQVDVDVSRDFVDGYAVLRRPFQTDDLARTVREGCFDALS
jgi:hypothetical protein